MTSALIAYLHYLSIFVLFALLSVEHVQFKLPLDLRRARSLIITDIAYGICAGVVLFTGLARVLWYGKGLDYYLGNSLFHAKVGLFILVGLISVVPTFVFINWRNSLKAGEVPQVSDRQARLVGWVIRLELLLLLAIPLLAVLMAQGYGVIA
jgi:putative membrane protein